MANQVTKIYELKTLGYDVVFDQLQSIEKQFNAVRDAKIKLNKVGMSTDDIAQIEKLKKALNDEKVQYEALKLQKQQLRNEYIAIANARQQEINASKAAVGQTNAEIGSIRELKAQAKSLRDQLETKTTGSILFGGQQLSQSDAITKLQQINGQIFQMTNNMKSAQDFGTRMTTAISNGFSNMKGQLSQIIFLYTGWFAAFREIGSLVSENIKLSDSYADLQIRIHGTRDDVERLVDSLRKIDTRTSLAGLVDIANIVAKKGVDPSQIANITAEFDKLNVVLGHEIGEPQTAVANIIKLITIFNDDKQVTAGRINEIATSLFKLTTSGVATGEFLVSFAERVGAVRGITGLTLPNVLGLGAALQQLGQRNELAGTAAVQLMTKVFADVPKFALAAQVSVEDFRKTLAKNPFEGLVQVAEGLKNLSDEDTATRFEEVVRAFGEVGVTGVRIKAVLGDIATNAEFVRDKMSKAAVTTEDYAKQSAAVELKQNTFAATLARVRKEFELLGTNKGVQTVLSAIAGIILLLVSHLGIILPLLATYGTLWIIANSEMLAARITTAALNVVMLAQNAIVAAGTVFTEAYSAAIALFTGATSKATAATTLFGSAIKLLGLGAIITLIAVLAGAFSTLDAKMRGTIDTLREHTRQQIVQQDIMNRSSEEINKQIGSLHTWSDVVLSSAASADTKRFALGELIKMNDKFSLAIQNNVIDLVKFNQILKEVQGQIELVAKVQAAASLTQEKFADLQNINSIRQRFEITAAQGGGKISLKDLPEAQRSLLEQLLKAGKVPANSADFDLFFNLQGFDVTKKNIGKWKELLVGVSKDMTDVYGAYNTELVKLSNEADKAKAEADGIKGKVSKIGIDAMIAEARKSNLTIPELQTLIKEINEERNKFKEGDEKLETLRKARDEFQARLDALDPNKTKKTRPFAGSHLTGEERDALAVIESQRQQALAEEELRFAELQRDHRASADEEIKYNENIKNINGTFLQQKINFLKDQGDLNAREKLQLAQFRKELIDSDLKFQKDRQAILDREFTLQSTNLRTNLSNQINDIQSRSSLIQADASLSAETRAKAKLDSDRQVLALQENFNVQMDGLEKKFNQKTKENADAGAQTRTKIIQDTIDLLNARIRDAQDAADTLNDEFRQRAADRAIQILQSGKSASQIARELKKLQEDTARDLLASQVAGLKIELDLYKEGRDSKIKTEKEYQDKLREYKEAEVKLTEETAKKELTALEKVQQALKNFVSGLGEGIFGIKKYSDDVEGEAEKQKDAFEDAYKSIGQAIQEAEKGYFDNLNRTAEQEHDLNSQRLEAEKQQVLARATTQAEKDAIDKQYAAKQKEIDRTESERKKQIALKQLTIDFAVAVIKSIAQYGLPLALIPIAAETALYFVQRSNIQKQTFARGGWLSDGGEIQGPSHARGGVKFSYNEAEGRELAIINKRSAVSGVNYQVSGTPKQIASAINALGGGIDFAPGGAIHRRWADGGLLGSGYPAPLYTPSNQMNGDFAQYHADIKNMTKAISDRIDSIEVTIDSDKMTNAQRKRKNKNEIGIL